MILSTGRRIETRHGFRFSLHFFRWGLHVKRRWPSGVWRHLVVKFARGAAFGHTRGRRMVYVGWWHSWRGERGNLNGFRLVAAIDKLPERPTPDMHLPFFPQTPREATREFEVR